MPSKDDNGTPVVYGVSHRDGVTPVRVKFDSDRKMLVDDTTTIEFNPSLDASKTDNDIQIARATSSSDDSTTRPWVVNEDTGAVLIDT